MPKIKTALISVYDKTGIADFARSLEQLGIQLISTGGTSKLLSENGIGHKCVEDITGFPERLEGRVKTLHPNIFMGILAKRAQHDHMNELENAGLHGIDLVVVNLYPFSQTIRKPDVTLEEAVEQIDIGGVALLRAAAKNFRDVCPVTSPDDYEVIIEMLKAHDTALPDDFCMQRAASVFLHTSRYDAFISKYLTGELKAAEHIPEHFVEVFDKVQDLRYGENPHQKA
ncbi:bifunctional phosphoribosylaminoimidazolecarboxamide formyltransferase/IMP cyclohydrolase, partial [candidate division KSB1 bacterium]